MAKKRTVAQKEPVARRACTERQTDRGEFPAAFAQLKAILTPYGQRLSVVKDDADWYYVDSKFIGRNKKPVMFAAVRIMKNYVSFHLMSIYANPKSMAGMSPALRKRMQGKACFNFTAVDDELFAELSALTKAGAEWFANGGLEKLLNPR